MSKSDKSRHINVRVTDDVKKLFNTKSAGSGTPSEILRELIEAYVDDRIEIAPPASKIYRKRGNRDDE